MNKPQLPLWFKIGYSVYVVVWLALYALVIEKPAHFLWLCHIGNVVIAAALWLESPLLLSWQALSLLFADLIWTLDFAAGLVSGHTPIGAAWYMFHPNFSTLQKGLSLFHLFLPMLLIWSLWRFGYDRRAIWLQIATSCIVFPISYLASSPSDNINWVYGPFGRVQHVVPPPVFLPAAIVGYLLALYVPSHLILMALVRRPRPAPTAPPTPEQNLEAASGAVAKTGI